MIRFFLILIVVLVTPGLWAQEVLHGVVRGTDGPIPGATIRVPAAPGAGTVSDSLGRFELNLPEGSAELEIRSIGYKTKIVNTIVPHNEKLTITLEESMLGLDEVVVTGTLSPVFVSQSPIKTEVLTTKHFNTFMPSGSNNLVDVMQMVNGVQEVVDCGVCFTNNISINGLPGQYSAILVDGTPMYGNLASVYGLNTIPGIMVDRVEVIKGPGSTLYGSEAVAGVINIITRDPASEPALNADVMGTSHGESFINLAGSKTWDNTSMYTGLNYSGMHQFIDDNSDQFGDIINMNRLSLFSKWVTDLSHRRRFTVSAKYLFEDRWNGTESFMENPGELRGDDSIYGESIRTNRFELFGSYEGRNKFKVDYSFSLHDQDSYYGSDNYTARQQIGFINAYQPFYAGSHRILTGTTFRYQNYDDNTVATPDGSDRQYIPGIFIQDDWSVSDQFTLLSGLRADYYADHGIIFSPRISTKYKAGPWTTIRLNSGTGFRIVNLFTEDHAFVTGQRTVRITEDLRPERSVNASLNINHIMAIGSSQAVLDIDLFYTYFMNKIIPDYTEPTEIIYSNSEGDARTRGLSLNWSQEFDIPLQVTAGLTWMMATETDGENQTQQLPYAPEWSGLFNVSYRFNEINMQIAWSSNFTGSMLLPEVYDLDESGNPLADPRSQYSPAFQLHNLQITKYWKNWRLYGGISNLFNYIQEVSPLSGLNDPNNSPGFSPFFDTAYSYAPLHGREVFLGISWSLKK